MNPLLDYIHMGGYADFVWSAYGITALGLIGAIVITWRGLKTREHIFTALKGERRSEQRDPAR